jgi:hypothetical protein
MRGRAERVEWVLPDGQMWGEKSTDRETLYEELKQSRIRVERQAQEREQRGHGLEAKDAEGTRSVRVYECDFIASWDRSE